MASSLLFKIASTFNNTGFREAASSFASTLGWVGKLSAGMAKFAVQGKVLGRIFGVMAAYDIAKAGFELVKFLLTAAPAAGRAEVSFTRLKTQLTLMGKGTRENLGLITKFADQVSRKSQFGADEVQSAVTMALRRTGDMRLALKQVSVAQDLAAATGMDLSSATNMLSRAQAGYTRGLTQVTNLRQADIQQAVRQGTILDLVGKKFAGSSSAAAGTYAGKLAILANSTRQLQEEFGKMGLPLAKFVTDLKILGVTVLLESFRGIGKLKDGLFGLPIAFMQASKEAAAFKKAMASGKEFTFNFDKELELANVRLGKTKDERQQIARDLARIEDILAIAEGDGVDALNKEQITLVQSYQWSNRELQSLLSKRVSATKDAAKKQFDATRERESKVEDRKGFFGEAKNMAELISGATKANIPVSQLANEISRAWMISKDLAATIASVGMSLVPTFDPLNKILDSVQERLSSMGSASGIDKLAAITGRIESEVQARIKPDFNVKIDFALPPEAIQSAVRTAIVSSLPGLIASLFRNSTVATSKETKAAVPLV